MTIDFLLSFYFSKFLAEYSHKSLNLIQLFEIGG